MLPLGKETAGKILVNHGAGALQMVPLADNRNPAAAAGDNQVPGFHHGPNGANLNNYEDADQPNTPLSVCVAMSQASAFPPSAITIRFFFDITVQILPI